MLANLINPTCMVIGGDMAQAGDLLIDALRNRLRRHALEQVSSDLVITTAQLGERSSVVGALLLALDRYGPAASYRLSHGLHTLRAGPVIRSGDDWRHVRIEPGAWHVCTDEGWLPSILCGHLWIAARPRVGGRPRQATRAPEWCAS